MSCPYSHFDGAYVLGALNPAERNEYEAHLPGCEPCAVAVARLAPVPGLLGRVEPAALKPEQPGPSRLPQLLQTVVRQRRRQTRVSRWRLAAAAAAAAVLAGVAVGAGTTAWSGLLTEEESGPGAPVVAMAPAAAAPPVTAQLAITPVTGGTEVWMACQYPEGDYEAPASTFRLVAVGMDGETEQLGSWQAAPGEAVSLTGLARFPATELQRIELQGSSGDVLLTYPAS